MPSSVVAKMIYDGDTETLRIVYVSGMVYNYKNVPLEVYQAMKNSGSKGTFLNNHIKNNYEFEKVND
ncbi:KTSC domain-containing protein [Dyadobacter alkalitolerans]|uniref:KTSC domain-containing protein n=1 Tax=Dyadobacter alkalitolerans TaxID=492736 RepID=UPI0004017B0E|nr:KTSC domain-containing protein [Dyadobacter alkalitolerans]